MAYQNRNNTQRAPQQNRGGGGRQPLPKVNWQDYALGAFWKSQGAGWNGKLVLPSKDGGSKEIKVVLFENDYKDNQNKPDLLLHIRTDDPLAAKVVQLNTERSNRNGNGNGGGGGGGRVAPVNQQRPANRRPAPVRASRPAPPPDPVEEPVDENPDNWVDSVDSTGDGEVSFD